MSKRCYVQRFEPCLKMQVAKGNFSGNPVPNNEEFYKKVLVQFPFPTSKTELNI